MRAAWFMPLFAFGVWLFVSAAAQAQPLFPHTHSIESLVANADLIFLARLEKFGDAEKIHGRDVHDAAIVIEETLKQEPRTSEPYKRLSISVAQPAAVLADWKERGCPLLVATNEFAPQETTVIELTAGKLEAMTADLRLIRDPEAFLRIAREAVRQLPAGVKRVHTFDLQVARAVIAETSWEPYYHTGGHLRVSVPVDQHLERRARDYVRSQSAQQRSEGARALVYFKSDENMALVKPLLTDPEVTYVRAAYENKPEERFYGVRYAAYETFKAWGIHVTEPVIREEVRK